MENIKNTIPLDNSAPTVEIGVLDKEGMEKPEKITFSAMTSLQKVARVAMGLLAVRFIAGGITGMSRGKDNTPSVTEPQPAQTSAFVGGFDFSNLLFGLRNPEEEEREVVPVTLKAGSAEEDLEVQIVGPDGKLLKTDEFVLTVKSDDGKYNKVWNVDDGYLHLTKIDSGEYTVTIEEKEFFTMPEPLKIKVQKAVKREVIDTSGIVVDESKINVSQEDASYGSPTQSTQKIQDTVEYIKSSSKTETKDIEVKTVTYKPYTDSNNQLVTKDGASSGIFVVLNDDGTVKEAYTLKQVAETAKSSSPVSSTILSAFSFLTLKVYAENEEGDENIETPAPTDTPHTHVFEGQTCTQEGVCVCGERIPAAGHDFGDNNAKCTVCGIENPGYVQPTLEPTPTPSREPSPSPAPTETPEPSPAVSPTPTPDNGNSQSPSDSGSSEGGVKQEKETVNLFDSEGKLKREYEKYFDIKETVTTEKQEVTTYYGWQKIGNNKYYYDKNGNPVSGTQTIQGVTYYFDKTGKVSNSLCIDVSKWNNTIDWNAVKNAGVDKVIIRVGYRGYGTGALVQDPKFTENISGAKKAGLKVGLYFFSQAVSTAEAVEEASLCINALKATGYGLEMPIYFDSEYSTSAKNGRADGLSQTLRTEVAKAFCATIQNAGYKAGVYRSKSWFYHQLNYSALSGYSIWVAHYTSQTDFSYHYDIWQYSGSGKISGVSTEVDMNIVYAAY